MFSLSDLEALKTPEEVATYQQGLAARAQEIETEFAGRLLSDEARAEVQDIAAITEKAAERKAEFEARRAFLEKLNAGGKNAAASAFPVPNVRNRSQSHVPENIYAFEEYRSRTSSEPQLRQAYRDGAMMAIERAIYPNPESKPDVEQAHLEKLLKYSDSRDGELAQRLIITGSPDYEGAFYAYLRGKPLSAIQQRYAALVTDIDAQGGYAVPFFFDPTLLHTGAWTNVSPYRQVCNVKTITGTDTYNGATVGVTAATRVDDLTAVAEGGPAIGQITATVSQVHAMVTLSQGFMQDRGDIVAEISAVIAEAKDTEEESIFTTGTGAALGNTFQPLGVAPAHGTAGMYTHIDTAGSNVIAAGDASLVEAALPIRHRRNAVWFMGRKTIRAFQALETTGGQLFGGQYYNAVGTPAVGSPTGNTGLRLLGYPLYEVPSFPTDATVDNTMLALLFDPASFYVIERAGMTVEVVQHIFDGANPTMPKGQRGIYAWWRNTSKVANLDAGRLLAALA